MDFFSRSKWSELPAKHEPLKLPIECLSRCPQVVRLGATHPGVLREFSLVPLPENTLSACNLGMLRWDDRASGYFCVVVDGIDCVFRGVAEFAAVAQGCRGCRGCAGRHACY